MRTHAAAQLRPAEVSAAEETNCSVAPGNQTDRFIDELTSLLGSVVRIGPNSWRQADNCSMSTAFWIVIAVLAVGTIASGLLRIRAWLQKPAPPEVIEAAHRHDDEDD